MEIIRDTSLLRKKIKITKNNNKKIGFVPTMGYLHEGHLSLLREAKGLCDFVVMSIFVNPIQFGTGEDYDDYPRDLSRDTELAQKEGCNLLFVPSMMDMYPNGYSTFINVERLTEGLCGRSRPRHFQGVTTIVAKLFNLIQPDMAFFGQKDAQQCAVIKKMVKDLNMDVKIVNCPIIREKDGLAMSSRNSYLLPQERKSAAVLYQSLQAALQLIEDGERDPSVVKQKILGLIKSERMIKIDYIEIVDAEELSCLKIIEGRVLIAVAVFLGKTRLIDNICLEV